MTLDDFTEEFNRVASEQNITIRDAVGMGDTYVSVEDAIITAWMALGRLNVKRSAEDSDRARDTGSN